MDASPFPFFICEPGCRAKGRKAFSICHFLFVFIGRTNTAKPKLKPPKAPRTAEFAKKNKTNLVLCTLSLASELLGPSSASPGTSSAQLSMSEQSSKHQAQSSVFFLANSASWGLGGFVSFK